MICFNLFTFFKCTQADSGI